MSDELQVDISGFEWAMRKSVTRRWQQALVPPLHLHHLLLLLPLVLLILLLHRHQLAALNNNGCLLFLTRPVDIPCLGFFYFGFFEHGDVLLLPHFVAQSHKLTVF